VYIWTFGSCNDVILKILSGFYQQEQKEVGRADIVASRFNTASAAKQTIDNTLGNMVNSKQIRRTKKGVYDLNLKNMKKLSVTAHKSGSNFGKSINTYCTN